MANECSTRSYQVDALLCLQILFWLALSSWLQEQRVTLSWEFIKDRFSYGDASLNSYRYSDTWYTAIADHTPRLLAVSPLFTVLTIVFVACRVSMLVRWLYFHWLSGLLILFTTCAQSRQRSGTHRSQRAIHSSQTLSRSTANCCCYIFHLAADVCVRGTFRTRGHAGTHDGSDSGNFEPVGNAWASGSTAQHVLWIHF